MTLADHSTRFDVFLSHSSTDDSLVERLAEQLRARGFRPWFDSWCLVPGSDWQQGLATGLRESASCAVLIGGVDIGAWQRPEVTVALDRAAHEPEFRVFLVLLPGMPDPFDPTAIDPFLSMRTWVDLRDGAEDMAGIDRLARAVQGLPIEGAPPLVGGEVVCPYRGLLPFREADGRWFFGRDGDVQRLLEKLKSSQFLAVLGPSGSGKSSLTMAGVLPALRVGAVSGSESWSIVTCTPGAHPLEALAGVIVEVVPQLSTGMLLDELSSTDAALGVRMRSVRQRVVVVVDQAEEAFALCPDPSARARFFANLVHASARQGPCTVIVTMRADFYPHAAAYPIFAQAVSAHQYLVGPLSREGLRQVIEQPALVAGLRTQPGLVDVVLDDVESEPGALPLLEHTLLELWERRQDNMLTLAGYAETGGVAGALAKRADQIWASFSPTEQTAAQQILLRLTQPGEGAEDTRRPASMAEIPTASVAAGDVERVVDALSDARLVTTSSGDDGTIVEVSHEALIRAWPRLRGWIDEHRDDLRTRQHISRAAAEWEVDRSPDLLWRGVRLATAVDWARTNTDDLNQLETEFLAASRREEEVQSRRRRRRFVTVLASLTALTVAAIILSVVALTAKRQATEQAQIADRNSRQADQNAAEATEQAHRATALGLAAQADSVRKDNPALALVLAVESIAATDTPLPHGRRALVDARIDFGNRKWQPVGEPIVQNKLGVEGLALSPDGALLAAAGAESVRLWNPVTGEPVGGALVNGSFGMNAVAFNPDGTLLASGGVDGAIQLWDPTTGELVRSLTGDNGWLHAVRFSPDGTALVSAGDGGVRWSDPASGEPAGQLIGHNDPVNALAFSPDGKILVTGGFDGTVRLWDWDTGEPVREPLTGHEAAVHAVEFNRDGTRLASAAVNGTVRVWDPATGDPFGEPLSHGDWVNAVTFSPDGALLASAAHDGTVRFWDPDTGEPSGGPLVAHDGPVNAVAFTPDGRLVTAGGDGTVRLWDPSTGDPVGEPLSRSGDDEQFGIAFSPDGAVASAGDDGVWLWDPPIDLAEGRRLTCGGSRVAFSPDGTVLATAATDGTVRLCDPATGDLAAEPLAAHDGYVNALALSPDGTLASVGDDAIVRLWDPVSGATVGHPLDRQHGTVVAFSLDGRLLATGGADSTVQLWDATTLEPVMKLTGHDGVVNAVAFSQDGTVASAGNDRTVRLWDPITGELVRVLAGHGNAVLAVAFSPDGTLLASASADRTVQLWDPATGEPIGDPLTDHTGPVTAVAFSPDGTQLASASVDGSVRRWDSVWDSEEACALAAGYVTAEQVREYLPEGQLEACSLK